MCVGLGGPLKITERGDQIRACVHGEGKTKDERGQLIESGYVETELVDGVGAGQNLVVRLDFDVKNKKAWQMNGKPTTETKVKEAMKELNIQVDNPLQFLPQDKVGQFSNMSPVELLKHTEMAIGPEVWKQHQEIIELDKEVAVVNQRLATEAKALEGLEQVNRALQQDVERFRRLQENKKKLDAYRGKLLWVEADVAQGMADEAKQAMEERKGELKALKQQYTAKSAALAPLQAAQHSFETRAKTAHDKGKRADQHTHEHMNTRAHAHTRTCTRAHVRMRTHAYAHVHAGKRADQQRVDIVHGELARAQVCMYACVYVCMHAACMLACMHACITFSNELGRAHVCMHTHACMHACTHAPPSRMSWASAGGAGGA